MRSCAADRRTTGKDRLLVSAEDRYLLLMHPPESSSTLSDDDQLSLWVGRVARVHALLEYSLSNMYEVLRQSANQDSRVLTVHQLAVECRRLLPAAGIGKKLVAAGSEALVSAQNANAVRNRVVHDMWLPSAEGGSASDPNWITFRRGDGPRAPYADASARDLSAVIDAHAQLVRTRVRISGLYMALHEVMPNLASDNSARRKDSSQLPRYFAFMEDRFTLEANGDVTVDVSI